MSSFCAPSWGGMALLSHTKTSHGAPPGPSFPHAPTQPLQMVFRTLDVARMDLTPLQVPGLTTVTEFWNQGPPGTCREIADTFHLSFCHQEFLWWPGFCMGAATLHRTRKGGPGFTPVCARCSAGSFSRPSHGHLSPQLRTQRLREVK